MIIKLLPWQMEYGEDLAKALNNKNITDNLRDGLPSPYTIDDAHWYINKCMNENPKAEINRGIFADDKFAGSIGVFVKDNIYCKTAEIGYYLLEDYWHKGIMTAAIGEICSLAFNSLDIVRIFAEPFAYNTGSRRALEKNGFVLEGIMKNGAYKNGKIIDYCMYALTLQ